MPNIIQVVNTVPPPPTIKGNVVGETSILSVIKKDTEYTIDYIEIANDRAVNIFSFFYKDILLIKAVYSLQSIADDGIIDYDEYFGNSLHKKAIGKILDKYRATFAYIKDYPNNPHYGAIYYVSLPKGYRRDNEFTDPKTGLAYISNEERLIKQMSNGYLI